MSASNRLFTEIREMTGQDYDIVELCDYNMTDYIKDLIDRSTLELMEKANIKMNLSLIEWNYQAHKLINYLNQHQPDRVASGMNYSQSDINRKLDQIDERS